MVRVIELDKVKDLDKFVKKLSRLGYTVEYGPHTVLEDHSEVTTFKVYANGKVIAYIVAHYITQYYRAVLSEGTNDDKKFLDKLFEIKYSGERWSIPVNPLYIVAFNDELLSALEGYEDEFPVHDGNELVEAYRSRNPNYRIIPRVIVARIIDAP